jgi:hypothetical protein
VAYIGLPGARLAKSAKTRQLAVLEVNDDGADTFPQLQYFSRVDIISDSSRSRATSSSFDDI